MNLPNKLTILRIILVPFLIAATLINFPFHYLVAGLLFGAASLTDMFDGKIARRDGLVTDFGKFLDPLADKIMVLSVLICFVEQGLCSAVPVIIIIFREFAITSIRLVASSKGQVVASNMWGKVKTVSQIAAIVIIYLMFTIYYIVEISNRAALIFANESIYITLILVSNILIWITAVFAVVSGIKYMVDNRQFISEK
ncbi:MAG: CDP-diacylglycerol--glycerol-3-phosphate 3-phosphatidyltransferase [Oscillospiraceae bacterium]|nr:CDP-diacylglycerol--glycerol-3-phosphate 3-phosphatidyltransferase [Candidatus Ruminococcus equi]